MRTPAVAKAEAIQRSRRPRLIARALKALLQHQPEQPDHQREHAEHGQDHALTALDVLAQAVKDGCWLRQNRLVAQIAIQIGLELVG